MKLRALTDLALRKSADPKDPAYEEWYDWPAGTVFEAPPNLEVDKALERGIAEMVEPKKKVSDGEG